MVLDAALPSVKLDQHDCVLNFTLITLILISFREKALHTNSLTCPTKKEPALSRAASNDYFDNRLVSRLFDRLIGLKNVVFFILLTENTLLHILSNVFQTNVPTEWYTYST